MENKIDRGCFDCSHRRFCQMLRVVKTNNTLVDLYGTITFFKWSEDIGISCQQNDRRLKE
jgi:hypothetical protein